MVRALASLLLAGTAQAGFVLPPYLQYLTDSSIVVRWESETAYPGKVIYGLDSVCGNEVVQPDSTLDHELLLPDLGQDTAYYFRAISGNDTSALARFRTMPGPGAGYRLIVFGDPHGDSIANRRVADRIAATSPDPALLAATGDLTANGRSAQWRSLFAHYRPTLSRAPLFSAPGNHDFDSIPNWFRYLCLPGDELRYSFRLGSASFHVLNAYESFSPDSSQYQWFITALRRDSADARVRHIFVLVHTPAYTTNTVYSGNAAIRTHLSPLFRRYGVKVVFAGHVHAYEHSLQDDVHYITTGGAGAALAANWNPAQPWTVYREAVHHFTLLDISGDTVLCRGVRTDGTEFDSLLLTSPPTQLKEARPAPARSLAVHAACHRGRLVLRATLPEADLLHGVLYRATGEKVWTLSENLPAGTTLLRYDLPGLAAGTCILRLETARTALSLARTVSVVK